MTLKKCTSCNGTGHDKPETAEERVRAWTADASAGRETDWLAPADLRAILAELDRVRKDMGEISATLFASKVEVERLRSGMMPAAQRPVDIEAVLAPIRTVSDSYAHQIASHENESDRRARAEQFNDALWHHTRGAGLGLARNELIRALAEAEKIGRGE